MNIDCSGFPRVFNGTISQVIFRKQDSCHIGALIKFELLILVDLNLTL